MGLHETWNHPIHIQLIINHLQTPQFQISYKKDRPGTGRFITI